MTSLLFYISEHFSAKEESRFVWQLSWT